MAVPPLCKKKEDCSTLIPDSISDIHGTTTKWILGPCLSTFQLPVHPWCMSEYWWTPKMFHSLFSPLVFVGGEKRRNAVPLGSPGRVETLSVFRLFPVKFRKRYQSHFKALRRHLFARDAAHCSDDCANSSNPTYSKEFTRIHTLCAEEHLPLLRFLGISSSGVCRWRSVSIW